MGIKISRMWLLNATTNPVVRGSQGMIKKDTDTHIKKIPGNPFLSKIQKIVLLITVHI